MGEHGRTAPVVNRPATDTTPVRILLLDYRNLRGARPLPTAGSAYITRMTTITRINTSDHHDQFYEWHELGNYFAIPTVDARRQQ
jgi:hypothetical protein